MSEYSQKVMLGHGYRARVPKLDPLDATAYFYGDDFEGKAGEVPLTDELLSHHLLFLGSSGTGKTTALKSLTRQLIEQMNKDDVMIVFDAKGDYLSLKREIDLVIDNQAAGEGDRQYWNLFEEISPQTLGTTSKEAVEAEINEIALTFFASRIAQSREPFFPNAGKDVLVGLMTALYRIGSENLSNQTLRGFLDQASTGQIRETLGAHPDLRGIVNYIAGDHPQTQGVLSEVQQVSRGLFQGNFAKAGTVSIRRLIRERGKRVIFIEYDLNYGHLLAPIYQLLFDLALKEALSQGDRTGRVYFILDEYRLLPNSKHLEIAANFGRSKGVKILLGLQSVSQLHALYDSPALAESLLSGLANMVVFRLNDYHSRDFVSRRLGCNMKKISWMPTISTRGQQDEFSSGKVVEDWDIYTLERGRAIVSLMENEPFYFRFTQQD